MVRFSKRHKSDIQADEKKILKLVQEGNERAFNLLFDRYHHKVYQLSLKIIKSPELAEEILFTVFLKIWQHGTLNKIENLESYLRVVARNETLKVWRSLKLEQRRDFYLMANLKSEHRSTEEAIAFGETNRLVNEAIELLPPQQEAVFRLCHLEGKKYEEAAAHLALSKLTVKTHMQLALRFIRKYLKSHTEIALVLLCTSCLIF